MTLLDVDQLSVRFSTRGGMVDAVRDVSLTVAAGETLGIVGESGSGKSVTALAAMGLLDRAGRVTAGRISFRGKDITRASRKTLEPLRGAAMAMVFQNARAALNPIRTVGLQIADVLRAHGSVTHRAAAERAVALLEEVRIRDPHRRVHAYPHELSGGMCQRVMIALATACDPALLIADEPTTGLDVTTQKAVMDLLAERTAARGMALVLITHDLGLAAQYCGRVTVMQAGHVVETAPPATLFHHPTHPYTRRLVAASPTRTSTVTGLLLPLSSEGRAIELGRSSPVLHGGGGGEADGGGALSVPKSPLNRASPKSSNGPPPPLREGGHGKCIRPACEGQGRGEAGQSAVEMVLPNGPLLTVTNLTKKFATTTAVDDVSFTVAAGESVGLVGESGSGKSTIARLVCRLLDQTSGRITLAGDDIGAIPERDFHRSPHRRALQIVFQDPSDSLNPRFTAADSIADPLRRLLGLTNTASRVIELAQQVGLDPALLTRFPHQLSGGQKARVGIARALATDPDLLVLDEPTAALDVSVQAIVLNLLDRLRRERGLAMLFVSHDLNVVRMMCDRVVVLREGRVVEQGSSADIFGCPQAAYTRELLAVIPHLEREPAWS
jgi:peptide/nickel transport system ATP-binding protein